MINKGFHREEERAGKIPAQTSGGSGPLTHPLSPHFHPCPQCHPPPTSSSLSLIPASTPSADWALHLYKRKATPWRRETIRRHSPTWRNKMSPGLQPDPAWKRVATHLRPCLHSPTHPKWNGLVCMECPTQRILEPICNKKEGVINRKRDTVTLQILGDLYIVATITANPPFIVLSSKVSFNQQPASAQPQRPDWPCNSTKSATGLPLRLTDYFYGLCSDIIEVGFTLIETVSF